MKSCGVSHWSRPARLLLFLTAMSVQADEEIQASVNASSVAAATPNIVFILADDLGYTDIAPYGSEVNTPTLSSLAEQGLRFTNYHTAANLSLIHI